MPLDIPISVATIVNGSTSLPSKTARLDLDTGHIYGYIEGLEAMEQLVEKALITPRFKCLIYDSQYGSESAYLIKEDMTETLFQMEAERIVKEALLCDQRIEDVYNFTFESEGDSRIIRFDVDTIYGTLNGKEVSLSV